MLSNVPWNSFPYKNVFKIYSAGRGILSQFQNHALFPLLKTENGLMPWSAEEPGHTGVLFLCKGVFNGIAVIHTAYGSQILFG